MPARLSAEVRQYLLITGNYWAFTLTDGALRMLVVLHFHQLGYTPLQVAMLFLFYEIFGVVTNLVGGWLGARIGLNRTMNIGLAMQVVALAMLLVPPAALTVAWVMAAQALSGIAKDLNKMSAKSSIKLLVPGDAQAALFRWVAALTGSKNALKGIGFFLGGALLAAIGFRGTVALMAGVLALVWAASLLLLRRDLGRSKAKPKFRDVLSKSRAINLLSAARLFLFGARDVWFVVALPVFLYDVLGWDFWQVGGFLAAWVIGYGLIQSVAPRVVGRQAGAIAVSRRAPGWAVQSAEQVRPTANSSRSRYWSRSRLTSSSSCGGIGSATTSCTGRKAGAPPASTCSWVWKSDLPAGTRPCPGSASLHKASSRITELGVS